MRRFGTQLLALLLTISGSVTASPPAAAQIGTTHYLMKQWSHESGAPFNRVNDLIEGSEGLLWLATYEGLVRYDGSKYRIFNHQDDPSLIGGILSIIETEPGTLWMVSTAGTLVRMRDGQFKSWTAMDGFPSDRGDRMAKTPSNQLVFHGLDGFLTVGDEDRIVPFPTYDLPPMVPIAFNFDAEGSLWVAPTEGGLWCLDGTQASFVDPAAEVSGISRINGIFPQDDGSLWLGLDGGVALYYPNSDEVRYFPASELLIHDRNLRMARRADPILVGGNTLGSLHFFTPSGIRPFFPGALEDPTETVNAITPLRFGGFAVGTYSKGLLLLLPAPFPFFNQQNGLDGILVNSIQQYTKGSWLIAHNLGLDIFDGVHFQRLEVDGTPFDYYTVDTFVDSAGRVWLGTFGQGLYLLDRGLWQHFGRDLGLRSNTIRAFAEDHSGNIWIATREGLHRWFNGKFVEFFDDQNGLRSSYVLSLFVDDEDRLWVGTARGGLHLIHNGIIREVSTGPDQQFATRTIFAMSADREGRIWGGMSGGIFRIEGERIDYVNLYERMNVDSVYHVVDDMREFLWLASARGLHRIPYEELSHGLMETRSIEGMVRTYGRTEGLPTNVMRPVSRMHRSEDNRLWFPTENGFFILDPAQLPRSTAIPDVFIDEVTANATALPLPWLFRHQEAVFPPGLLRIQISFTAPGFNPSGALPFRVRLKGFEEDWRTTTLRAVEYTSLRPGNYVFEVQAGNDHGLWSDSGATFAFNVQPRFVQTVWFYFLSALVFIGLVVALYHRRTWVMRQRQKDLIRLVDERTREIREGEKRLEASNRELQQLNQEKNQFLGIAAHDLRNPLAAIESVSDLIQTEAEAIPAPMIKDLSMDIIDSVRRMNALIENLLDINRIERGLAIINIRPFAAGDVVESVLRHHQRAASSKEILILEEISTFSGSPEVMADPAILIQILDNLVSNAIKFSPRGSSVWIQLEKRGPCMRFGVRDEGPGIAAHEAGMLFQKFSRLSNQPTAGEPSTGLGLSIAKHLTELMGGRIGCESEPGSGAKFWVEFPLSKTR